MTSQKWSRTEKIAVGIVTVLFVGAALFLWVLKEALVGHSERTDVWSCTVCLKDKPEVCGVFTSHDAVYALSRDSARDSARSELCEKMIGYDRDRNVCNYLNDRDEVTCSSRKEWVQTGGSLGVVH